MNTLVCKSPGKLEYQHRAMPVAGKGNTVIKIRRIGICGTDLHAYKGNQPFFTYPRVLGHELSAEIWEMNGDESNGLNKGDTVTIIPYFSCGQCVACRAGKSNCCVAMNVCGVHSDGGMTEYFSVPSTSLVAGEGLSLDALALVEPLAIGAHGVRRASIQPHEFVLVMGAGPIGLATMESARLAGARVIALDIEQRRLDFCRNVFNIQHVLNASSPSLIEELKTITSGDMPTVIIDATGNQKAINNGFSLMSHGGRYVLIGLQLSAISFSHPEFHKREGTLMSSRNATPDDFHHVIDVLKRGDIDPNKFMTHRVNFGQIASHFPSWVNPAAGVIKAMIEV